ncbi:galactitol-1-phosphate 5-dehydrogenase [Paenibacillus xerothermodurans]|uniref:Galactitol-1-phosphate 5-dehydrogenase n=1 Tax=Paenibacillus xerothermodurans TaxID=1977292 RepID=A0A2W1NS64_PAEXE|nr:galactitol-1-phosphate 5-dehydrogenase [Paenibacillus xerothermodurans]PZE20596.1 galactitol-1-phosphate 5-dehydrogenase [Paenibacillus xerothermodurans]
MHNLVWTGPKMMEMKEAEVPAVGDNELLVKVEAVGICGSEIEGYLGHNSLRVPPLVMGHEFSGTVTEVGGQVQGLMRGQRVVVNPLLSCGSCNQCRKGLVQLCSQRAIVGIHRPGAFAQFVSVPASSVHVVPDELDFFRASLTEPLACSLRAARRAMERHPFANVVIFGAGTIGLLAFLVAQTLGASRIIVVDSNEARLATPQQLGAFATINPKEPNFIDKVKQWGGASGTDVVIDAAGFQPTRDAAVQIVNPGGTIMNIGLGIDHTQIPINVCIRSEISILGSFSYDAQDFHDALELLKSGKIDPTQWSEIRPLYEGNQAFQDLVNGRVAQAKIFLTPNN